MTHFVLCNEHSIVMYDQYSLIMFSKSKARTWTWTWSFGFQIIEWHAHVKKEYIKHEVSNLMFNKVSCYFSLCSFHFEKWSTYKKLQKRSLTMNIKKVLAESMQLDFLMFIRVIAIKWRIIKRNIWGINNSPLKIYTTFLLRTLSLDVVILLSMSKCLKVRLD